MNKELIFIISSVVLTVYLFLRKQIKKVIELNIVTKYFKLKYKRVKNEEKQEKTNKKKSKK